MELTRGRATDGGAVRRPRPATANRPGLPARLAAVALIGKVVDERRSLEALFDERAGLSQWLELDARDRALARAIATVAIRHRGRIGQALALMLDRPPPAKARFLLHMLHAAAAQILFMDAPDSAAVDLAVTAISADGRTARFSAMANAVLRRLAREREAVLARIPPSASVVFPDWLAAAMKRDHGRDKADLCAAMVSLEPVLDLTPHPRLSPGEADGLADRLGARRLATGSWRVTRQAPVPELPGYDEGLWWVQDAASALPARLLGDVAGLEVADLCAAPGGKTAQLAAAGARVTAVDVSPHRLERLTANLARLGLEAEVVAADILQWEPGRTFDAILLDAPCSSTGTLRRHPDVAWTKTEQDVTALAQLQRHLALRAASLLRPGGVLVYSNCSMLKEEGENLVASLHDGPGGLRFDPVLPGEIPGTETMVNGRGELRTLPSMLPAEPQAEGGLDGFYACRFRKEAVAL